MPQANVKGMTQSQPDDVSVPCLAYSQMAPQWELIQDLLGGTEVMRAARERWLPKEPAEPDQAYTVRLSRSILYNAFKDTLLRLASKPFSKVVTLQGKLPDRLQPMEQDMDRTGRDLTQFARDVFIAGATYGKTHILVDYPKIDSNATLADEKNVGARPVAVHVQAPQLIGWKTDVNSAGVPELAEVRILERRVESVEGSQYADVEVNWIRVYTKTTWQLWRQPPPTTEDRNPPFALRDQGEHTFGKVPLVTVYFNQTGFLVAEPPLIDLAWLNLAHWQTFSDQRNILRVMRCGILFGSGFTQEEMDTDIVVGPNRMVRSKNPEAQLRYVEHSGSAVGAGQTDIDKLEQRMEVLGLQPLVSASSGQPTATAKAIDEGQEQSDIQSWIRSLELGLQAAFGLAAEWTKETIPEDFRVDIFSEFGLSLRDATDLATLSQARASGDLTRLTYLRELKRRGVLGDNVSPEQEDAAVQAEGPSLADIGGNPDMLPMDGSGGQTLSPDGLDLPCPAEGCTGTMIPQEDGSAVCDTCGLVMTPGQYALYSQVATGGQTEIPCPVEECDGTLTINEDGSSICETCGKTMTTDETAQYISALMEANSGADDESTTS